jgi:N-acetylglucosamine-6-phosphate deacetylase
MYALTNCILHSGCLPDTNDQTQEKINSPGDRSIVIEENILMGIVNTAELPSTCEVIDLEGSHVAPGFIDMQLNGCGGVMFNDAITAETLDRMHQTNLKSGTTSYLPTLITAPDEDMLRALEVVALYRQRYPYRVLGLHLEGPYLNPKRKGIHNEAHIRLPDRPMIEAIAAAGREVVRLVTLAPEQVEPEVIRTLAAQEIIVSAGHSDATYEQAQLGFAAGIRMVTHLFNAMSPWLGRSPGMVGASLNHEAVYAGIIADGQHVHFDSIQLAHKIKRDHLILVTDATPPVGTAMTSFVIGGQEVFYRDGKCVSADGTLGGSALTLIEAVANCVREVGIPLPEALCMASTYPARLLGLDQKMGRIAPGYLANLAIFDADFHMVGVVDQGQYTDCR